MLGRHEGDYIFLITPRIGNMRFDVEYLLFLEYEMKRFFPKSKIMLLIGKIGD